VIAFAVLFYLLFVVYFMACVGKLWKLFLANLLAGNPVRETHFSLILANIKQSQNLVLIRKTKEKEEKKLNIFENLYTPIQIVLSPPFRLAGTEAGSIWSRPKK
jgi:hypothetical protein